MSGPPAALWIALALLAGPVAAAAMGDGLEAGLSGSWYDPSRDGQGLMLEFYEARGGRRGLFASWYTFDGEGRPLWLVAQREPVANPLALDFLAIRGPRFLAPPPGSVERRALIAAELHFRDCRHLDLSYRSPELGAGRVELVRLTRLQALRCLSYPDFAIGTVDVLLADPARGGRELGIRVYAPLGIRGERRLVLISIGGFGTAPGLPGPERSHFAHLAEPLARAGMVAIVVGHRRSPSLEAHRLDRPRDLSFLLDALAAGRVPLPASFAGTVDTGRVGVVGHSAGAYAAMAVGGARYPQGEFRDPRVAAIVPISPQGVGEEFQAYDRGGNDHTWAGVAVPTLILLGRDEIDLSGSGSFVASGWRLRAFARLDAAFDRHQIVIDGQDHLEMGGQPGVGDPEVRTYLGAAVRRFLWVELEDGGSACRIGDEQRPGRWAVTIERKVAPDGALAECLER